MAAISWALLGLVTGWVSDLVHEGKFTFRRRVGTYVLAAGGALVGGIVGAAFGLGSFSLIRFGSWHTAISSEPLCCSGSKTPAPGLWLRGRTRRERPGGEPAGQDRYTPGAPGPRFTTPTYVFEAHGRTRTVPGFEPLGAYEVALHNLAPELKRRPAPDPAGLRARRAGEPHAAPEVARRPPSRRVRSPRR